MTLGKYIRNWRKVNLVETKNIVKAGFTTQQIYELEQNKKIYFDLLKYYVSLGLDLNKYIRYLFANIGVENGKQENKEEESKT